MFTESGQIFKKAKASFKQPVFHITCITSTQINCVRKSRKQLLIIYACCVCESEVAGMV